jgi:hypothetical protein
MRLNTRSKMIEALEIQRLELLESNEGATQKAYALIKIINLIRELII